jgi:branched-chain amino acid transport system permease protein
MDHSAADQSPLEQNVQALQKSQPHSARGLIRENLGWFAALIFMILLPFAVALLDGQPITGLLASEPSTSKFVQGLVIEIFILAAYALSYDLILGITGLLSFGHAMFFAVGAYLTGIMLKSFGWSLLPTLGLVILAGVAQALLFGIVLPRVKGITFALVTLGLASVFYIVIQSRELGDYTGADVGLQGVVSPDLINFNSHSLNVYFITLAFLVLAFILFRRFVNSPTGRVCIALRENEERTLMLGYNTFYFKLTALTISSITAALAGMLHTLHSPLVSPSIASLSFTVTALLIILIGGMGTLSGAIIGAVVYRLLEYGLSRYIPGSSSFITGAIYILIVLFVPYGIVGTWRQRRARVRPQKKIGSQVEGGKVEQKVRRSG